LVLTRAGFVEAVRGSNGFVCLVVRSFEGPLADTSSWWNPRIRAPHCLNPAAVRTVLPGMEKRAALVMAGVPAAEIVDRMRRGYKTQELPAPENGAMAYMMSREQYLSDDDRHWKPHVMFYYGGRLKGSQWGAGGADAPVIDGGTDEASAMTVLLIPVAQWADGTPIGSH
jgi:hypothetical protein